MYVSKIANNFHEDLQSTPGADQPDEMPIARLANDVMNALVIENKISGLISIHIFDMDISKTKIY